MRKQLLLVFVAVMTGILMLSPNTTNASSFTFDTQLNGDDVSATMDVIFGTGISVVLNNTSDDMGGYNAPGITEFGFDVNPEIASSLVSWDIFANGNTIPIDGYWNLTLNGGPSNNFSLDFFADTNRGVNGALYNPLSDPSNWGNNGFFTEATLAITLAPSLSPLTQYYASNAYLKFQNIGDGGAGSLKARSVPDADIMLLLGSSLIVLGLFSRKRKRS